MLTENMKTRNKTIILASSSYRRKKLLKLIGLKFKAIGSNINEDFIIKKFQKKGFKNLVKILSLAKAISVVGACHGKPHCNVPLQKNGIVAGFDTIVVCKNKIIGKPKSKKDALRKILFLSGKEHKVLTGIALIDLKRKKIIIDHEVTKVKMRRILKKDALSYIKTKEPLDKAGAYAIQGKGGKFVKSISGDYFNVVGLPLNKFLLMLEALY